RGREPERDEIEALERDRERRALQEAPEPAKRRQRDVTAARKQASTGKRDQRDSEREPPVQREPPRERDHAVRLRDDDEEEEAARWRPPGSHPAARRSGTTAPRS